MPLHVADALLQLVLEHGLVVIIVLAALLLLAFFLHRHHLRKQNLHLAALREREEKLRLALWASGEMYWQYDMATRKVECMVVDPESGEDLDVQALMDRQEYIHPVDLPVVHDRLRAYLRGDATLFLSEHRVRDGEDWQWLRARGRAVAWDADGRITRIAGTVRNITSIREKERERRISGEVMRNMAEAVVVVDADFRFVAVNPAFILASGYDEDDVIGKDVVLLHSPRHDRAFYLDIRKAIVDNPSWRGEMWQRRKDGREFLCEVRANAISEPGTSNRLYVMVWVDITERRRIEQELRYLANYDTLTNLPNRTQLTEKLSHAIVQARRHDSRLALMFIDLDNFKDVNDTQGHATGDRTLRAVARRLREILGEQHVVARIGGDEFTVILEDVGSADEAEAHAQRVIDAFDQPLWLDERHEITITPSIGISLFPDHGQVPSELLQHADTAMYQAKADGRRTFLTYVNTMEADIRRRAGLIASLRRVIERDELHLVFQPQMSLADGRIVGVEALLRWRSPGHGDVPPAQFIPLAEESGLIVAIGDWALNEACRTLADWCARGVAHGMTMSVNVSAVQLLRSDLPETVRLALAAAGLPAHALSLELTESVLMAKAESANARLQAFRGMGVEIAIDDFGTGYSSLAYLQRLPICSLKIDKAFIDGLLSESDTEDNTITSTVIAMSHSLGLQVVAEGVETAEQVEVLRSYGCDCVQGYWLSSPLPAEACLAFLQAHRAAA